MSFNSSINSSIIILVGLSITSNNLLADHLLPSSNISIDEQSIANQHCSDNIEPDASEPLCEIDSPNGSAFNTSPILNFSTQVDIRPITCESFFDDYLHTRRGIRIESALHTTSYFSGYMETVSTFPVIDFISEGKAHVTKSKDLTARIYNDNSGRSPLFDSIVSDAEDIEERFFKRLEQENSITASVQGKTTTIRAGEIDNLTVHIIIQAGMATPDQINQIKRAKNELNMRWGFKLEIFEIP